jgi:DNA-binding CsgD family transcriptional regulator
MNNDEIKIGWALIPPQIIAREDISANEKIIFGRIMGLLTEDGYCFASNYWLGKQIGLKPNTISTIIGSLKNKGIIRIKLFRDYAKKITGRHIFVRSFDNDSIPPLSTSNTPPLSTSKDSVENISVEFSSKIFSNKEEPTLEDNLKAEEERLERNRSKVKTPFGRQVYKKEYPKKDYPKKGGYADGRNIV